MQKHKTNNRNILSVSELNRNAKLVLESNLPRLWIEGEISNFAAPSSGHWYFTLKDASAQVRCAMFRGKNRLTKFQPQDGQKILVQANVSLYEGRGDFQLIVDSMEPAGQGDLQRQFEALKAKLHEEGLFDDNYKLEIPEYPKAIGIITSPTGAAIHDILSILERRFPALEVTIIPVMVQGQGAAEEIAAAISLCNELDMFDTLIVGRGGGSLEDLWAFNEEIVARAIFESDTPIISAVGHEVDFTIADFVADLRAPTPSAAAELCAPEANELLNYFEHLKQRLADLTLKKVQDEQTRVSFLNQRLVHPAKQIESYAQTIDHLEQRLHQQIQAKLKESQAHSNILFTRLKAASPAEKSKELSLKCQYLYQRLQHQIAVNIDQKRMQFQKGAELLNSFSPLKTLERGYAVARNSENQVIRRADSVKIGENIDVQLAEGALSCTVDKIKASKP